MHAIAHASSRLKSALFVPLLLLAAVGPTARMHAADQPQPGPEHKRLEVWVGDWTYKGETKETPFGPASKFAGKQTCRMVLNGFFLETRWEDKTEAGYVTAGIDLQGYNAATNSYATHGFENEGTVTAGTQTVEGRTWSGTGTRSDPKGKSYKVRFTATFAADGKTVAGKLEFSPDDGKTWMPYWDLLMTRVAGN